MQKQKLAYNHLLRLGKLIQSTQKAIGCQPRKTRMRLIKNIGIEIKIRLSPEIPLLLLTQISLRPKPPRNIMAAVEEAIQLLELMPLRLPRKTKTKPRI